jgi:hypothetical protein
MNNEPTRPARSARRRIALTFLGVLVALGATGYAVHAATSKPSKPTLSLHVSPKTVTTTAGSTVRVTLFLTRVRGLKGHTHLRVTRLPKSAKGHFARYRKGRDRLRIPVPVDAKPGTYHVMIRARIGKIVKKTTFTLVITAAVGSSPAAPFALAVTPASQSVIQSDSTSYTVTISRNPGFKHDVALTASGLPAGATASFSPATVALPATTSSLTINTASTTPTGTFTFTVTGDSGATRSATAQLVVTANTPFTIAGDLPDKFYPGTSVALNLSLTNPQSFDLKVSSLTVSVANSTSSAGCTGSQNFSVTQFSGSYPLTLHPGNTSLSSLVSDNSKWPHVRMLDLPSNQDACKNATFTLNYTGAASK